MSAQSHILEDGLTLVGTDSASVFGPLVGPHDVEDAILEVLQRWERTYVFEVARRAGMAPDAIPAVRWWKTTSDATEHPEDHHPAVIVRSQAGRPIRRGGGSGGHAQTWRWEIEVCTQVVTRSSRAENNRATPQPRRITHMLSTALRSILTQQRDEAHLLGMIDVLAERYALLVPRLDRSIHQVLTMALVEVPNVVEWSRGPGAPYYEPDPPDVPPVEPPDWPVADPVETHLQKVPLDPVLGELDVDDPDNQIPPRR